VEVRLRYCPECKRDTIQAIQKVLSCNSEAGLRDLKKFFTEEGYAKKEKAAWQISYYCPNCGKERVEVKIETPTKYEDKELNFSICRREEWQELKKSRGIE